MTNYRIKIKAQVEWETEMEAASPEEAERVARYEFDLSQLDNNTLVVCVNEIQAVPIKEPEQVF
jgi:hypothetical protein